MSSAYESLLVRVQQIHDLSKAAQVLSWDREVIMPPGGHAARLQQITTLQRLTHEMATSDEMGALIEAAASATSASDYDSMPASLIRLLHREYERGKRLPADFMARRAMASGEAHKAWVAARQDDNFAAFQPHLERMFGLAEEAIGYLGYDEEPYDALLGTFEHGTTTRMVRALFAGLKAGLVPLREGIDQSDVVIDDSFLRQSYPVATQREACEYLARAVGYDFDRGHLGTAVHPFATSFSRDDARITTRWYDNFLNPSIFGTLHESGHALYEMGTHPDLFRTPLARGTSAGVHESQSRTVENVIGRSRPFWAVHLPRLQQLFPDQLGEISVDHFYQAINKVQPSLIRVEADEVTYNLHIILRFELEQAVFAGDVAVADLPEAWRARMKALLGVTPPTDREGVLQDVHWSAGLFGHFASYALGNLYAAQFLATARTDTAVATGLDSGDPAPYLAWLVANVHQHGKKFTAAELVKRVTGRPLSHEPLLAYLKAKYSALYDLAE